MKLKKIMCAAMAGAMALSMSATVLANDEDSLTQNVEVSGVTQTPTISLSVPDDSAIVLNPYKMTVKVKDGVIDATNGSEVNDQIISAVSYVTNTTDVALDVSAAVTGKIESPSKVKPVFATTSTAAGKALTTKSVFMYFEAMENDSKAEPDWEDFDAKATNQIVVAAGKATTKKVATLAATDGSTANYLAFRFNGDMVTSPTEAWAETDVVSASIAFTFTPTVVAED